MPAHRTQYDGFISSIPSQPRPPGSHSFSATRSPSHPQHSTASYGRHIPHHGLSSNPISLPTSTSARALPRHGRLESSRTQPIRSPSLFEQSLAEAHLGKAPRRPRYKSSGKAAQTGASAETPRSTHFAFTAPALPFPLRRPPTSSSSTHTQAGLSSASPSHAHTVTARVHPVQLLPNIEEDDAKMDYTSNSDSDSASDSDGPVHWRLPPGVTFASSAASTPALSYTRSPTQQDFVDDEVPGTPRDNYSSGLSAFNVNNADAARQLIHARNGQGTAPHTSYRPTHALPVVSPAHARYAVSIEDGAGADDLMDLDTDHIYDSSSRLPSSSVRFATPALRSEDATAPLNDSNTRRTRGSSAPAHLLHIAFQHLTARIATMQETVKDLNDPARPFVDCASACVETVLWLLARSEHLAQIALYRTSPRGVDIAFVDGHGRLRVLWDCNAAVLPYVAASGAYVNADTVAVGDNLFSRALDALVTEKAAAAKIFRILLTGTRFQPRARATGFFDFERALNFPHARKIELATTVDCGLCDVTLNAENFKPTVSAGDLASLLAYTVCPEKLPLVDASKVIVKDAVAIPGKEHGTSFSSFHSAVLGKHEASTTGS
ncbi:hypothetical protein EXIGLDRAFT_751218 [Exidia glandulosa HHB12029]|uniref:Uncharacterized protein n=1 Tax=Exidia glandulosa HHB12029 TaxID=1314781 RepID=A0A166A7R7_EXIGL|nr:hypothetical protein EXIGLDRAFT_751218 [Exidia glandulosa HHB12029]